MTHTPGKFGRALLKFARKLELAERHWVYGPGGAPIASVVPVTSRLRKLLDTYKRFDVVDGDEVKQLALRTSPRTLVVEDAAGNELGLVHNNSRRGNSNLIVLFHALPEGEKPNGRRPPVVGALAPREGFRRGAHAYGVMEVIDTHGRAVARVTNTGGFNNLVELQPTLADPLRSLTVAFACSLVDHSWMHIPTRRS